MNRSTSYGMRIKSSISVSWYAGSDPPEGYPVNWRSSVLHRQIGRWLRYWCTGRKFDAIETEGVKTPKFKAVSLKTLNWDCSGTPNRPLTESWA